MTDVFISYSKKAAEQTRALADQLEGLGCAVWWDKELLAGQNFDHVIREKLCKAGAIAVIWTPDSVVSDYVKVEAGIGLFRDKLISLRTSSLRTEDIPTLFRPIHTIDITDISGIVRALEDNDVYPAEKALSKEKIMLELSKKDKTLPAKVECLLNRCKEEGFHVVTRQSFSITASTKAGKINFGSFFPNGTFNTYYISESAKKFGCPDIAKEYLYRLAKLLPGGSVREEKSARVDSFGELPRIDTILPKAEAWIELMKIARSRFDEAGHSKSEG